MLEPGEALNLAQDSKQSLAAGLVNDDLLDGVDRAVRDLASPQHLKIRLISVNLGHFYLFFYESNVMAVKPLNG